MSDTMRADGPLTEARRREIAENYRRVKETIEAAKAAGGCPPGMSVFWPPQKRCRLRILFAVEELGLDLIGENRAVELTDKYEALSGRVEQHFIGHLQTNKVGKVVGRVSVIESVDSLRLAKEIDRRSEMLGITTGILVQINSGREENKSGVFPEEAEAFLGSLGEFSHIRIDGIMTMAPVSTEKEEIRKYFRETYSFFIDFFTKNKHNIREPVFSSSPILSMGMSDSYEIAVEEGATEVRVGSAIFGRRLYPAKGTTNV